MKFIEGKKIADEILENVKGRVEKEKLDLGLAVILVGEDKASKIYMRSEKKAAEKIGMNFFEFKFTHAPAPTSIGAVRGSTPRNSERRDATDVSPWSFTNKANIEMRNFANKTKTQDIALLQKKIINKISRLNQDKKISGIIVQLPLPKGLDTRKIINSIDPRKDADGFHPENIKLFFENRERFWPVFPKAIIKMIESAGVGLNGKSAVIIANSEKFGGIMDEALKKKNIKARHILANNIEENAILIKQADIIITACGIPSLIKGGMIKKGAIIIDGGVTKEGKKVLGDVNIKSVENIAGYVSPVPGGVGPVTVACLLENVYFLASADGGLPAGRQGVAPRYLFFN